MNENEVKEKVQKVYFEPRAPEKLIQSVILRAKAVTMGLEAQKQLATAPAEKVGELASRALIGQLATLTELPKNTQPEQLAQQLQDDANTSSEEPLELLKPVELLTEEDKKIIAEKMDEMSDQALRVLSVAYRTSKDTTVSEDDLIYQHLLNF